MHWWEIARAQSGAITHAQLRSTGVSSTQIDRLAARGELDRSVRGVFLAGGAPRTFAARLWTAHLATGGVLGFTTAGRLWGTYDGPDDPICVIVEPARRIAVPDGVLVRRSTLPPGVRTSRAGLPCTARAWTLLDLLGSLPYPEASRLADRAVQRGWLARDACAQRLARHPHRRGNVQLRRIADQLTDGAAARSERILHDLLRRAGIRDWTPNHEIWLGGELIGVIDVAIPSRRIAVEVDGMAYHVDVDRFRRDRSKQNALVSLGWTVLRFTWADLVERPGYVVAMLRRVAA